MQNASARGSVQSVDRAVAILNSFLGDVPELALRDVARLAGLTPSTAHRLLATLQAHGLVEQRSAGESYTLGAHIARLGRAASDSKPLVVQALPLMNMLRDRFGETVGLHVRKGPHARVVVAQAESPHQLRRTYTEIGEEIPIHLGAPGKLLLAYATSEERQEVLGRPLVAATSRTIVDVDALREELTRIRKRGYALSLQERNRGVCTVAVPVFDAEDEVGVALGLTGPAVRLDAKRLRGCVPSLQQAAAELSAFV
jgi:DNA-binding IclR family transcriptional regulator